MKAINVSVMIKRQDDDSEFEILVAGDNLDELAASVVEGVARHGLNMRVEAALEMADGIMNAAEASFMAFKYVTDSGAPPTRH